MKDRCDFHWFGQKWECVRGKPDDAHNGGECDNAGKRIIIDLGLDQEETLTVLHHELVEGSTYLIGCVYSKTYPDDSDLYIMTHSQMDLMSSEVRGAYEDIKRKMTGDDPKEKPPRAQPKQPIKKSKRRPKKGR